MEVELSQEIITENMEAPHLTSDITQTNDTEYELDQSESLTFLYNLLYDDQSNLSKTDILNILNALKLREENLPFAFHQGGSQPDGVHKYNHHPPQDRAHDMDLQGVHWPPGLQQKFASDRKRIGNKNWFHNIPNSLIMANDKTNVNSYRYKNDFFQFNKFYSKLKLHITHFQLRNLVCCSNLTNGIFYPSSYYHDHNLQTVNYDNSNDNIHSFFKINRLINAKHDARLDCLIDSRSLLKNLNSRISTLSCSDKFLVSGTFEGDYILNKINTDNGNDNHELIGEYHLTNNYDGITNSIIINNDQELIISSNDKFIRYIDLDANSKQELKLPFAVNCLALNKFNPNEYLILGDDIKMFIIDKRLPFNIDHAPHYHGQEDYSFSCDWSSNNEHWLLSGNQDGCVRIWDRRYNDEPLFTWSGSLGGEANINITSSGDNITGAPVRNTKFSQSGDYICWAESLDHIGILKAGDLKVHDDDIDRIQSIDFIGKCTGINFINDGYNENLIIGVNDCPLGGILSYNLESREKILDFDFNF